MYFNKEFYEEHSNFVNRTLLEYFLSPGIRCKYDLIIEFLGKSKFENALDLGCSGDSILHFLKNVNRKYFLDLAYKPLNQYKKYHKYSILNANIISIPTRDNFFNLITILDVLEHIYNDNRALNEIYRVLRKDGIFILTVPHRMRYFTNQDILIGHYRRYEENELKIKIEKIGFRYIETFSIYGQIMKFQYIQKANPKSTENGISSLRKNYRDNIIFRKLWNKIVLWLSNLMKLEAISLSLDRTLNICMVFKK